MFDDFLTEIQCEEIFHEEDIIGNTILDNKVEVWDFKTFYGEV